MLKMRCFFELNRGSEWSLRQVWGGIFCLSLLLAGLSYCILPTSRQVFGRANGGSVELRALRAGVQIATIVELQKNLEEGRWLVFDARKSDEYQAGHLPNALSFPYASRDAAFQEWAPILEKGQKVIVYCSSKMCDDALNLALFLREFGFTEVILFIAGIEGWKNAGLALERE